jgi:hypothetical protein
MRKIREQHYFTVRGRGFDLKQWSRVLSETARLVESANKAGYDATFDGDARRIRVRGPGTDELVIYRAGEPGAPNEIMTEGDFDDLVQTLFTAIKKIAPDVFEMTSPDGRDYRRLYAKQPGSWSRMKRIDQLPKTKEEAFLKAMGKQKWRHPETSNQVEFISLPKKEQTKLRHRWEQEFGERYQKALDKARSEYEEAHKEVEDAASSVSEAKREKEKAEKAKGLEEAYEKTLERMARHGPAPEKANSMDDEIIRRAAIRVAAKTENTALKHEILSLLRGTEKAAKEDDGEKEGRFEEGEDVDVGKWLRDHGHEEAARAWERYEGDVEDLKKKSASSKVFPEIHDMARRHVLAFAHKNPTSKVATGSTRDRVAATDRLAKKWIQDAIKRPGRVREYLDVPEGEDIPMGKLDTAIEKVKGSGNKSLLSALLLAKRLKKMDRKSE